MAPVDPICIGAVPDLGIGEPLHVVDQQHCQLSWKPGRDFERRCTSRRGAKDQRTEWKGQGLCILLKSEIYIVIK